MLLWGAAHDKCSSLLVEPPKPLLVALASVWPFSIGCEHVGHVPRSFSAAKDFVTVA
jgi:hypothetical protein